MGVFRPVIWGRTCLKSGGRVTKTYVYQSIIEKLIKLN